MENFCQRGNLSQRILNEMKAVLYDRSVSGNQVVYKMCRAEKQNGRLRYDLTLLCAKPFGKELAKTYGHYHKTGKSELYEEISGDVFFLIQKQGNNPYEITEAYLIQAKQSEKFIIPPNFAMTAINPSTTEDIIMANWIDGEEQNDYAPIENLRGFCYYILSADAPGEKFNAIPNENYKQIPPLIRLRPRPIPKELEDLKFLIKPEKYEDNLTVEKLYEKIA